MFTSSFPRTVFLSFTKLVAAIHSLMNTVFISEQHLQPWITYLQWIWQIFLFKVYRNFKGALAAIRLSGTIIISGGHLQWSSIFKSTVFLWRKHWQSSLFSKILSYFASSCSYPFDECSFSIIKEQLQPHILSKLLCFFRTGGVVARRYHGYQRWYPSVSGMYKLKDSLLSDSYPFLLWYCRYFKGALCLCRKNYCNHPL